MKGRVKGRMFRKESEGKSFVCEEKGFVREERVCEEFAERGKSHVSEVNCIRSSRNQMKF